MEFLNIVPKSTRRLLDIGCGHGDLSGNLRRRGIEVIGVDRDESVCTKAREKLDDVIVVDIETAK